MTDLIDLEGLMDENRLPMGDPDEAALQELDAALARWGIEPDEHGRIRLDDLWRAFDDGRVKPTVWTPEYQQWIDDRQKELWRQIGLGDLLESEE